MSVVDPNITQFIDLAINDPEFRGHLDSEDRDRILGALGSANGFSLTDAEKEAAADAWLAMDTNDRSALGGLESALSHFPVRTLGN